MNFSFLNFNLLHVNFGFYLIKVLPCTINAIISRGRDLTIIIFYMYVYCCLFFFSFNTNCLYKVLSDVTAVDFPQRIHRFEVVYHLLSISYNSRIRVKTSLDGASSIISVCSLYSSANWFEREIFDLFGILFTFHPNMSRILTDYGFVGHPLLKDFPIIGFYDVSYSFRTHSVIRENINNINEKKQSMCDNPWLVQF